MKTRLLESRDVLRTTVTRAERLEAPPGSLLLATRATVQVRKAISSADGAMVDRPLAARDGQVVEGRLRLDLVRDNVLRVRYAPGTAVPENRTPMLVEGALDAALAGQSELADGAATLATPAMRVRVGLDPFRIEVRDAAGRRVCGASGPEVNHFCPWDTYNTGVCTALDDGTPIATECFDLAPDECLYGLGETFGRLNKVGQTVDLFLRDALGVTSPRCYKCVPFFLTTRGYGVFLHHSSPITVWAGSLCAANVQVAIEDDFLDYFILVGDPKTVLAGYTGLTGRSVVPPKWTFGYWQSKISYTSAAETLEVARTLRAHEIPCDVIHLDTHWFAKDWLCDLRFDPQRFPDPKGYFSELAAMGFKVSLWQLPYIPSGSQLYDDLAAVDGFVKTAGGQVYDNRICFAAGKPPVGVIDYTNPDAVRVHQRHLRRLFELGAKVIKTDFGEEAPADGVYHDGTPGWRMHNLYPLLYNRAVAAVTGEATGDPVVWARSAWAGSQRYPIHWGGDNSPNYANMAPQLVGGLSLGLSGFPFWSHDIGGFNGVTSDRLLIRWMQVGMFLSHSRIHGYGPRELYRFEPETVRVCREYIRLRYRLMPYVYGQAIRCVAQSLPMLRALVVEFPRDPNVWNLGDEFLFGDSLLVAPILDEGTARRVYLPAGTWTDWWTGRQTAGERWVDVEADLETLPLFVREGAAVPLGPVMNYVDEKPTGRVELRIAPFTADGRTRIDVPLGEGSVPVEYVADGGAHRVTIGPTDAAFDVRPLADVRIDVERR